MEKDTNWAEKEMLKKSKNDKPKRSRARDITKEKPVKYADKVIKSSMPKGKPPKTPTPKPKGRGR